MKEKEYKYDFILNIKKYKLNNGYALKYRKNKYS